MTIKRTDAQKWAVSADEYGRSLAGLTLNLLVRDVARSLPFYVEVLGFADHTYAAQPWAPRLREAGKRGFGAEIRVLGIDPEAAEQRARDRGFTVLVETKQWPHGWRDVVLEDPDGYTFAVGVPK